MLEFVQIQAQVQLNTPCNTIFFTQTWIFAQSTLRMLVKRKTSMYYIIRQQIEYL